MYSLLLANRQRIMHFCAVGEVQRRLFAFMYVALVVSFPAQLWLSDRSF